MRSSANGRSRRSRARQCGVSLDLEQIAEAGMGAIPISEWPAAAAAVAARCSACLRLTRLSGVLQIRVSVVGFRPWPPPQPDEAHAVSGITRGLSAAAGGGNGPTTGLRYFGPTVAARSMHLRMSALIGSLSAEHAVEHGGGRALPAHAVLNEYQFGAPRIGASTSSQLPGETEPVEDIHFHPVAPRTLRVTATTRFYGDAAHFPAESSR